MQRVSILIFTSCLLFILAACTLLSDGRPDTAVSLTPSPAPTPTITPAPAITPDVALSAPVTKTTIMLTVWIPPEIWAASESGQATLNAQLNAYRANHPDLEIRVESKAATGQGSILNYLRTGRTIAPNILPDLVALPSDQLASAAAGELIYALNDYVDPTHLEDLYPAGLKLVTVESQTLGYPFVLSQPPHLAYNSTVITTTVPSTWTQFIQQPRQHFVFPAGGTPGATLLLEMYLDNGGKLINEAGQFELQVEPLAAALQQLSTARSNGFILPQSSNLQTLEDSWQIYQTGQAAFVQTTGSQYLRQRTAGQPGSPAAIPGQNQPLRPLVIGWAWAISTSDSAKRPLAADLLTFLVGHENLGAWSQQSQLLPARQGAFFYWPEDDPYVPFISNQLLLADAHPFTASHPVMLALTGAVFDVVSLAKSPQAAAEEAVASLQQ